MSYLQRLDLFLIGTPPNVIIAIVSENSSDAYLASLCPNRAEKGGGAGVSRASRGEKEKGFGENWARLV